MHFECYTKEYFTAVWSTIYKIKIGLGVKSIKEVSSLFVTRSLKPWNKEKVFLAQCYCNLFGFSVSINSWSIFFNFCNYIDKLLLFEKGKEFLNKRNNFCFIIYLSYVVYSYFFALWCCDKSFQWKFKLVYSVGSKIK